MKGRERPCSIRPQLRSSQNVLRRSVEPAPRSRHSSELTDVGKSSTDHGRRVLACPPGHPANGDFTDPPTRTQSLNGLRAYRFVDESRSARSAQLLAPAWSP